MILALETSCDDTCAALLAGDKLLANIVSSQNDFHARYGGVVPEVASRRHLELINPVINAALAEAGAGFGQIKKVAVTTSPGLIGALLVGVATAKAIAWATGAKLIGVNHIEGHIAANYLDPEPMEPPFVCLVASGGHTAIFYVTKRGSFELLGSTLDDAAGEALDKGARLLGLGYPGGADLDLLAVDGDPSFVKFPVGLDRPGDFNFSFSGVKTSLFYYLKGTGGKTVRKHKADIAASYQSAVVSALVKKTVAVAEHRRSGSICLSGGVSANTELRRRLSDVCHERGFKLRLPPPELCTDNAAMVASAARYLPAIPFPEYLSLGARASAGFVS